MLHSPQNSKMFLEMWVLFSLDVLVHFFIAISSFSFFMENFYMKLLLLLLQLLLFLSLWRIFTWNFCYLQQQIWDPKCSEEREEIYQGRMDVKKNAEQLGTCFDVKNAVLFPPEVEKGMWPENYSLSDHARLTVIFSPVRMSFSPPIL